MRLLSVSSILQLLYGLLSLKAVQSLGPFDTADCYSHPDPHFQTWQNVKFDYQHGCDVVLINSADIIIQLRLAKAFPFAGFSQIERLAIHFSNMETIEIDMDGDHYTTSPGFISAPNPVLTQIGGWPFTKTVGGSNQIDYKIDLSPPGHFIEIVDLPPDWEAGGLGIFIRGHGSMFLDATGMCATWNAPPNLHDRAGNDMLPLPWVNPFMPFVYNGASFGDVWQVENVLTGQPAETNYISTMNLASLTGAHHIYPTTCMMRRRLDEEDRALVQYNGCDHCLRLDNLAQRANCQYDLDITQDCTFVTETPFYKLDPKPEDTQWYNADENCCYRYEQVDIGGVMFVKTDDITNEFAFARKGCDLVGGSDCERKYQCESTDNCYLLQYCDPDFGEPCYRELDCFKECVRHVQVQIGYKLVSATQGYNYDTACPHADDCKVKEPCVGSASVPCFAWKPCSTLEGDENCVRELKCDTPCAPTQSPTTVYTPAPTPCDEDDCIRFIPGQTGVKYEIRDDGEFRLEHCLAEFKCFKKLYGCVPGANCYRELPCQASNTTEYCRREVPCVNECVLFESVEEGIKRVETSGDGWTYDFDKKCPHNDECIQKIPCQAGQGTTCQVFKPCSFASGDKFCEREVPCTKPCAPTQVPSPSPTPLELDIPTQSPTCTKDDSEDCLRRVPSLSGYRTEVVQGSLKNTYSRQQCLKTSKECFKKIKCTAQYCYRDVKCKSLTGQQSCFQYVPCKKCIRRELAEGKVGVQVVSAGDGPGFIEISCPYDKDCRQQLHCHGGGNCSMYKQCNPQSQVACYDEFPCPQDCSPTAVPTEEKTPSPTACVGNDCVRIQWVNSGIKPQLTDVFSDGTYRLDTCDDNHNCYRRKECIEGAKCYEDATCNSNGNCIKWVPCVNECVRRETVENGFRFVPAAAPGFNYEKNCELHPNCQEKIPCTPDQASCQELKTCTANDGVSCFNIIQCSESCSPTDSPTQSPTTKAPSTDFPTQSPTQSPTSKPTPEVNGPCVGCEWWANKGKIAVAGQKKCIQQFKVKVTGTNGLCRKADCVPQKPCKFSWKLNYTLKKLKPCLTQCKIVSSIIGPVGSSTLGQSASHIVKVNKKRKGVATGNNISAKCVCEQKLLQVQMKCGAEIRTFTLNFMCSECDQYLSIF